MTEFAIYTKL